MSIIEADRRQPAPAPAQAAPPFMSQHHVDVMNALLKDADAVKDMCASLGARHVLSYDLIGGPDAETVHWTVTLDETVHFSLDRPSDPDVVLAGDWSRMMRASRGAQEGEPQDPGLTVHGDLALLAKIGRVLDVARHVAAVPVTFPEV